MIIAKPINYHNPEVNKPFHDNPDGGKQSLCITNVGVVKEIKIYVNPVFVTDEVSITYIT